MSRSSSNLQKAVMCSFFACLTAVFSQILIPMVPIPISLATLSVLMAGGLLGPKWGALSQLIYLLLGAFGIPVFAQMTAGVAILVGPSGGYIVGYICSAFTVGFLLERFQKEPAKSRKLASHIPYAAGVPACYIPGTAWFMFTTGSDLITALIYCVIPFLIGDFLKILCAEAVVSRVKHYLKYM